MLMFKGKTIPNNHSTDPVNQSRSYRRGRYKREQSFARWTVCMLGLSFAPNVFAYLDPGTGSIIIQGLIAGIAMAGVTARMYWHKLCALFGAREGEAAQESEASSTEQDESKS